MPAEIRRRQIVAIPRVTLETRVFIELAENGFRDSHSLRQPPNCRFPQQFVEFVGEKADRVPFRVPLDRKIDARRASVNRNL